MKTRHYVLIGILVLALAALACGGGGGKPRPDKGDTIGACVVCEEFVKNSLVAPKTAEFPACSKMKIEKVYGTVDTWTVIGYVDAQNRMGALLRSIYLCEVEYKGNEKWGLIALEIE